MLILYRIINWFNLERILTLIIFPALISIGVSLYMEHIIQKEQINREVKFKIVSLENKILEYNELFTNNYPLYFITTINQGIIVDESTLGFDKDVLQEAIHKMRGHKFDKKVAEYILSYTNENMYSSSGAYLHLRQKLGRFLNKYELIQTKLEHLKEQINLLENDLGCESSTILNNIYKSLKERENLHNNDIRHIKSVLKEYDNMKQVELYKKLQYSNFRRALAPKRIIGKELDHVNKNIDKVHDKVNTLISSLITKNREFLIDFNNDLVEIEDYCRK